MSSCQAQKRTAGLSLEAILHPADHLAMTLLVYWKGGQGHCIASLYEVGDRWLGSLYFGQHQLVYNGLYVMSFRRNLGRTAHNARRALIANDLGQWEYR